MGKLIISTHITVDGIIGPSPQDWAILEGEGERYKFDQLLAADAFLLGRKVYEGLANVWPSKPTTPASPSGSTASPSTSPPGPSKSLSTGTRC